MGAVGSTSRFDVIGFDADDTLWHSEDAFHASDQHFVELLSPYVPDGIDPLAALRATETSHIPISGYGVKAYTLSMVQTAITITDAKVSANVLGALVEYGLQMLTAPVKLLPHVPEVLADLAGDHRLVLITKGDLVHQTRKITTSGIDHHFAEVDVVLDKDPATYERLLRRIGVDPDRFCMVGNSVRSDILPVLELGGHAVHVPYPIVWEHEDIAADRDVQVIAELSQLPAAVRACAAAPR